MTILFTIVISTTIKYRNLYLPIILGVILYLSYIIWVGGDFMSGRFFVAPLVFSIGILANININSFRIQVATIISIVIVGFSSPSPSVLGDSGIRNRPLIDENGICDERVFYYTNTSLILAMKNGNYPNFRWIETGRFLKTRRIKFAVAGNIGFIGYYAGKDCYIMDELALCDPLLSRLPTTIPWRIGHYRRDIPAGYEKSTILNINHIEEPSLSEYYDKLKLIIKANIWGFDRLSTIWKMNTGQYDYLLTKYIRSIKNDKISKNY